MFEIHFTYNTAKNTHRSQKPSNKSCSALNFVQKSLSSPRVELGAQKFYMVEILHL